MRTVRVLSFFAILLTSLTLGCGGSNGASSGIPTQPTLPQTPPTTLTGNWFLTGSRVPTTANPTISTSLAVQGSAIGGEVSFSAGCSSAGVPFTNEGSIPLDGTINNDGTFQATSGSVGDPILGTTTLTVTGNSPTAAAPSVWTGTYILTFTPGTKGPSCSIAQSASFTATAIAPVTGTYIGTPAKPNEPFGDNANISVQITQGAPTIVTTGGHVRYMIPLTANLAITNSPCAISASTSAAATPSTIGGDRFVLLLTSGFPYGFLSGILTDPSAKGFSGDLTPLAQVNGCPGVALYNFTRQ